MLSTISANFDLFLIDYYRKIDEIDKSREKLETFLKHRDSKKYYYMIAFDGALKLSAGRLSEAHGRFEECLRKLPDEDSDDRRYVALFCECALSLRDSKEAWRQIRREAIQLRPSRKIRQFLPFPSEERLNDLISGRA